MDAAIKRIKPALVPLALKDAPALIERVFPAQKISAEAQKERKAGSGQTLTALGSYWKGRKPLIMVRAIVLASLLPVTDELEADLAIFEKLMAIDDDAFGRREPKLKASEVAQKVHLENPWDFFDFRVRGKALNDDERVEVSGLRFPIRLERYPKLLVRWKLTIDPADQQELLVEAMRDLPYEEKVAVCKRPEECDPQVLYWPVWPEVNAHLARFGIETNSFESLIEQLGILRYGHRPRVGDTFCGGGSIPFEAARLGCDVYASDLNPVACMLTWGALNIIGASPERRTEIEQAQHEVAKAVDQEITDLGIEHNSQGDRAKAYLYCLETRCPETGWRVPMAPNWVISKTRNVYARLVPNHAKKRFDIEVIAGADAQEMKRAEKGTVDSGQLVYELDGKTYRTPIRTLRGDYRDAEGNNRNRLRQWEKHDFKPRPDDIFQERLYAIQWIKVETLDQSRQETYFASVAEEDLDRERKVEWMVEENLARWQEEGLVPDMAIEPGAKTNEPIRTRGWRYWHQLFSARHLLVNVEFAERCKENVDTALFLPNLLDNNNKLCQWLSSDGDGRPKHLFSNQAFNTFWNFPVRCSSQYGSLLFKVGGEAQARAGVVVAMHDAREITSHSCIYISDPPYADAINYHEITEFFIAWLRKDPPPPFNDWTWDSRRALAIKGSGDEFRRAMVDAYKAMTTHMPDNGLQCVMFTHQDTGVWADMVSIFWAAGLQVVGAWYIATEASTALRSGGHVQGTITLILRKRLQGGASFRQRLLPKIRKEVATQIESMLHLNEAAKGHGNTVFNDSDLQMAGYAAALKVLTGYSEVDGRDVTTFALQPRQKGNKTVVDEIVEYAAEVANTLLIPEQLKALNPDTWSELKGVERFYLRLLAIEQDGTSKLDNYQNFSKAFHVDYPPLMASLKPNAARLKGAKDFKPRELASGEIGGTLLGELLMAIQELLNDKDPKAVVGQLRASLNETYFAKRTHLRAIAQYLHDMLRDRRPEEAQKAEIIANRIRNEGI